jgi:hypothetical protein
MHKGSLAFRDLLFITGESTDKEISLYLTKINKGSAVEVKKVKTLIAMDATGSMNPFLTKAKNTVGIVYERAGKIMKDNGLDPGLILIQYACYRNYTSTPDLLLQHSPWESKP